MLSIQQKRILLQHLAAGELNDFKAVCRAAVSGSAGFGWSFRALPELGANQDLWGSEVRGEIAGKGRVSELFLHAFGE